MSLIDITRIQTVELTEKHFIAGAKPEFVKTAEGLTVGIFLTMDDYQKVINALEGKGYTPRAPRTFDRDSRPPRRFDNDRPRSFGDSSGGGDKPYYKKPFNDRGDSGYRKPFGDRDDSFRKHKRFDDEGGGDNNSGF